MKKIFLFSIFIIFTNFAFSQSQIQEKDLDFEDSKINEEVLIPENKNVQKSELTENLSIEENSSKTDFIDYLSEDYAFKEVDLPPKKRPKKADPKKIEDAELKDEEGDFEKTSQTIKYGTSSEIAGVIDKIIENEDPRYNDVLYDLFQDSKNIDIRTKIIEFFTKQKDPCLEDYAIEILNDPYDYPNKVVENVFRYVAEVDCKIACPCVIQILEIGNEDYFNAAIATIGKIGGPSEALYMASYLERDDLKLPQRQTLMRTLGQMCAVETWDKLVEIIKDEDENSFVRMYAAESIGKMKKEESIPILINYFENSSDPNMRQYCLKGLINFPENSEVQKVVMQATRDEYYKVRIEAIKACKEMNLKDSVPFLIYRAQKDSENVVKKECYPVLANLNTKESNEFLINQITEKKVSDSNKILACSALIENGSVGEDEILELAKNCLNDDKRKSLRNELGKLFIKYVKPSFSDICAAYLQSKDLTSVSQGLEMYKNGRFETAKPAVEKIANEEKKSANKTRARKILGLPEEEPSEEKEVKKSEEKEIKKSEETSAPAKESEKSKENSDSNADAK